MILLTFNDAIEWSLDFGPDSMTLTVKDLVHGTTKYSRENPSAAWRLLFPQRLEFLNNHLTQVPINPKQQGTQKKRDEVLSSVGAQIMDTNRYEVSDLDDVELYWEEVSWM